MTLTPLERLVVTLWEEVVLVSRTEQRQRQRGKETEVVYVPTLEKLEAVLDAVPWNAMPIARSEATYYIVLYHRAYLRGMP